MAFDARNPFGQRLNLGGVPIAVHASYWLTALAIGLMVRPHSLVAWFVSVTATLAVHEWAHVRAYRAFGHRPRVWLYFLGGATSIESTAKMKVRQLVAAHLAGPAANLAVAALAFCARRIVGAQPALDELLALNAIWGLANLIPIAPLDGNKLLSALLWPRLSAHARTISMVISLVVGVTLYVPLLTVPWPIPGFLIVTMCLCTTLSSLFQIQRAVADRPLEAKLVEAHKLFATPDGAIEVQRVARELVAQARSTSMRGRCKELLAWSHLALDQIDSVERVLQTLPPEYEADPFLEGRLLLKQKSLVRAEALLAEAFRRRPSDHRAAIWVNALLFQRRLNDAAKLATSEHAGPQTFAQLMSPLFHAKRYEEARAVGERWFAVEKKPLVAFNLGCTLARLSRPNEAVSWLSRAVEAGWRDLVQLDEDSDLEPLRKLPAFAQVRAQLTSLGRTVG